MVEVLEVVEVAAVVVAAAEVRGTKKYPFPLHNLSSSVFSPPSGLKKATKGQEKAIFGSDDGGAISWCDPKHHRISLTRANFQVDEWGGWGQLTRPYNSSPQRAKSAPSD